MPLFFTSILTLIIANCIAALLERRQWGRLKAKYTELLALQSESRVPVTVITGFLGAGKTTLLNKMLLSPSGRRILVIENEIGALSIDHALLQKGAKMPDGVQVLANGCMCCSAGGKGGELERTLDRLLQLSRQGPTGSSNASNPSDRSAPSLAFDHVVIELSGAADPAPIIQTFARAGTGGSPFYLNSVVAVVDASNLHRHVRPAPSSSTTGPSSPHTVLTPEVGQQLAYSDIILLNKTDMVGKEQLEACTAAITALNPAARVVPTIQAAVDVDSLLTGRTFDSQRAAELLVADMTQALGSARGGDVELVGRHAIGPSALSSVTLDLSGLVLPVHVLLGWVRAVVAKDWEQLCRVKGLAFVVDDEDDDSVGHAGPSDARVRAKLFAVQGVHAEVQGAYIPAPSASTEPTGDGCGPGCGPDHKHGHQHQGGMPPVHPALVLIGKGLDHEAITRDFEERVRAKAVHTCLDGKGAHGHKDDKGKRGHDGAN